MLLLGASPLPSPPFTRVCLCVCEVRTLSSFGCSRGRRQVWAGGSLHRLPSAGTLLAPSRWRRGGGVGGLSWTGGVGVGGERRPRFQGGQCLLPLATFVVPCWGQVMTSVLGKPCFWFHELAIHWGECNKQARRLSQGIVTCYLLTMRVLLASVN